MQRSEQEPQAEQLTEKAKQSQDKQLQKEQRKEKRAAKAERKTPIRRIFPIWLRVIVVFMLAILALILGLIVGYSVLGDGEPLDVLRFEFWQHILDIISGVE
ncbi:DNA-directed RNA polymerase subunit beta [Amphibacillus marinus]|uniref:DNA-directed RNA polymerase subunit beta n=1 Tax=Amphibacillus marinus TaxID=872970 RepID=A0A1H8N3J7_9BACI|nr:DNA-directed RNA polymerase subunit beta [Amphibacillus marinus]SEO24140.1 DNA-directed RNA polymerase subunit beta [Amphibacillus marinus]